MSNLGPDSIRVRSVVGSAIAVLVAMCLAATVNAAGAPERDAAAITTLQGAITAMGGANVIATIQDCILTGTVQFSDGSTKNFNWTIAGNEFRRELDFLDGSTSVFYSGHGSPASTRNGTTSALRYHIARANLPLYLPPYLLFQELTNPQETLKYVGIVQVGGQSVVQVHISDDSDAIGTLVTPQEWYFDPTTFLPVGVQFREPSNENAADYVNAAYAFSTFTSTGGVSFPSAISYMQDEIPIKKILINLIVFNSGVPQGYFDPPQGGGR